MKKNQYEVNVRKAAMIGCGFVGSASAFALMQSGLFSELVLIDADKNRAEGEALDISHGVPFARPMKIYAGDYDDIVDASVIIITAGANQKPDETRLDLVHKNVDIFKQIIPEIAKRNCKGILLIVSNPVDILTYVAIKLSGFEENRVIGSGTVLDTARLKYELGEHLGVDSRTVHAFIIGEHGDSEIAAWSSANVSGIPINTFCEMRGHYHHQKAMQEIADTVKNSAYEIIAKKRATYYGIGMSVKRICEAIVRDEKSILPVSGIMHGEYGIEDVSLSMPAIVGKHGIEAKVPIVLNELERSRLEQSADTLRTIIDELNLNTGESGKNENQ
ncbi:MAG: L-lactate dehydrogenase [Lachnospiraceae bacterium]|nr:L-lactate dehydrogenase [Lachnospiraceae bacterium]